MYYHAELRFFRSVLEKMLIQSHIVHHQDLSSYVLDFGLRKTLGTEMAYDEAFRKFVGMVEENTVYKLTDAYCCNYMFMILPDTDGNTSLVMGPYLSFEMSTERLMEEAEHFGIPASQFRHVEAFYRNIPVLPDDSHLMMIVNTLAENLWGTGNAYKILDLQNDGALLNIPAQESRSEEDSVMQMRLMEQRYAYENDLIDKVSKGLWHRVELMLLPTMKHTASSVADPIRNQKNSCIICKTLLRKAAEKGGVHPLHLDKVSTQYSRQIELITSVKDGQDLILEMAKVYCRLVRQHNIKNYSALIQKILTYIDAEIASDLSLAKLAKLHNVSPEYLSSLFHKETQKTLTQYINEKRLELGADLLRTTNLQIQTVAENSGFPDAGYFAKLFKKRYGLSPKVFREQKGFSLKK